MENEDRENGGELEWNQSIRIVSEWNGIGRVGSDEDETQSGIGKESVQRVQFFRQIKLSLN